MSRVKEYSLVESRPVAKFYYQGSHTHPIRRTVLVIEENDKVITGYELREGNLIRSYGNAVIRSYRKDRIANYGDYCRLKTSRVNYKKKSTESTLRRFDLIDLIKSGV